MVLLCWSTRKTCYKINFKICLFLIFIYLMSFFQKFYFYLFVLDRVNFKLGQFSIGYPIKVLQNSGSTQIPLKFKYSFSLQTSISEKYSGSELFNNGGNWARPSINSQNCSNFGRKQSFLRNTQSKTERTLQSQIFVTSTSNILLFVPQSSFTYFHFPATNCFCGAYNPLRLHLRLLHWLQENFHWFSWWFLRNFLAVSSNFRFR